MSRPPCHPVGSALLLLAGALVACSPPQLDNTRLTSADLVAMTDKMAASLLAAEPIRSRGPDSEPWVITLDRVHNRTNDIIPSREKWAFVARLRALLSESDALRRKNLRFIVPAERAGRIEAPPTGPRAEPTHALAATFYALTNRTRQRRSDTYLCAFQLLELQTDRVLWEDRYEVKRSVVRNKLD